MRTRTLTVLIGLTAAIAAAPAGAAAATFSSSTPIATSSFTSDAGALLPYPSTIGVFDQTGTITTVKVTLSGIAHERVDELQAQLVGPSGANTLLFHDICNQQDTRTSPLTFTFDDAAAAPLPVTAPCASGAYRTSAGPGGTIFFPPAASSGFAPTLAPFTGTNPNGLWHLYVTDGTIGEAGTIAGWSIDLTTTPPAAKKCKKKGKKRAATAKKKRCKKKHH